MPPPATTADRPAAVAAALGADASTTSPPRPARSRPRCGPGSPPPAARWRRSSRSSSAASRPRSTRSPPPGERGETVWPVIDYADIAAGPVPPQARALLHRRGCLVVRGHFDREQALGWDRDLVELRRGKPLLRELPRAGRRLLRQRRLQARDLPGLLVAGPDAGPAERPDGAGAGVPQPPVEARVRAACAGSTRTGTRCTRTASAAAPRAPTPAAWAPTSTRARSTCG